MFCVLLPMNKSLYKRFTDAGTHWLFKYAGMVKLVNAVDLESTDFGLGGSSPPTRTKKERSRKPNAGQGPMGVDALIQRQAKVQGDILGILDRKHND